MSDVVKKKKQREASKRYYANHRDEVRAKKKIYMAAYYMSHRDKVLARSADWAKAHPDRIVANTLRWRVNLAGGYEAYRASISTRLRNNISNLMWYDLRRFGIARGKAKGTRRCDLVSWSIDELMAHLEQHFSRGMSWSNYGRGEGRWSIDHIKPRSSFRFTSATCSAFRRCWSLNNMRPMWSVDNTKKGARTNIKSHTKG